MNKLSIILVVLFSCYYLQGRTYTGGIEVGCFIPSTIKSLTANKNAEGFHTFKIEEVQDTICNGTCKIIDNVSYCETGTYPINTKTAAGVDTSYILNLYVQPPIRESFDLEICYGDCIYTNRDTFCDAAIFTNTLISAKGCDSIVTYSLTVKPKIETNVYEQLRYGECLPSGANLLCESGVYDLVYIAEDGCDSIVYINLDIAEPIRTNLSPFICAGDCFMVGDSALCKTGNYRFLLETADGQDSLLTVNLTVERKIQTVIGEKICEGDTYNLNGIAVSDPGNHTFTFQAASGCDSTVLLELIVGKHSTTRRNEVIPQGEFLSIDRSIIYDRGTYQFVFPTYEGCDSTIIIDLSFIGQPTTPIIRDTIFKDTTITIGNPMDMRDTIFKIIDTIIVSVDSSRINNNNGLPPVNDICDFDPSIKVQQCHGTSYRLGDNIFWESGIFDLHYETPSGCDRLVILELDIERDRTYEFTEHLCVNESIMVGDSLIKRAGHYEITVPAVSGCDSLIIVDVTADAEIVQYVRDTICEGEIYEFYDTMIVGTGQYFHSLTSYRGCDSLIILELQVKPSQDSIIWLNLCAGDFFTDGRTIARVGGTYRFNYTSSTGCDSIITLNLNIPDTVKVQLKDTICHNEQVDIGVFAFNQSGSFTTHLFTQEGCDSLVLLDLFVEDCRIGAIENVDTILCGGFPTGSFSFTLIKGRPPFTYIWDSSNGLYGGVGNIANLNEEVVFDSLHSGTYYVTISDEMGELAELEAVITQPEKLEASFEISDYNGVNVSCVDGADGYLEIVPRGGLAPYTYEWETKEKTSRINNLAKRIYTVTVTDAYNCSIEMDSVLTEPQPLSAQIKTINPNCEEAASGRIEIKEVQGGMKPYRYRLSGASFKSEPIFEGLEAGDYLVEVMDINNCPMKKDTFLEDPVIIELEFEQERIANLGTEILLKVSPSDPPKEVTWSDVPGLSCYDCLTPLAAPEESSSYFVTVKSIDDCVTTGLINILVSTNRDLYVPNIFSPRNKDGINDILTIFAGPAVERIVDFQVFTRWGEMVYSQQDYSPNESIGWDGSFNGRIANQGVYIWRAKVFFKDDELLEFSGDFILR